MKYEIWKIEKYRFISKLVYIGIIFFILSISIDWLTHLVNEKIDITLYFLMAYIIIAVFVYYIKFLKDFKRYTGQLSHELELNHTFSNRVTYKDKQKFITQWLVNKK